MPHSGKATVPVHSCRVDDSLQHVAEIMWRHDCSYVLVVDTEGQPTGMLTDKELCTAAREQDRPLAQIKVSSIAAMTIFAKQRHQALRIAGQLHVTRHMHIIPIVDGTGSLLSVATKDNLARYLRIAKTRSAASSTCPKK
jgi:predicted transcriptional regulator